MLKALFILIPLFAQAHPACPKYEFSKKEFSFESFNPTPDVVDGVRFPGTSRTLYRGIYEINPQFDVFSSLQAMFREKNWHVGSPIFYGITQVLTGVWNLEHTLFPTGGLPLKMRQYFEVRKILPDVEQILNCAKENPLDIRTAQVFAADLMNKVFFRMTSSEIQARYFNIKHPNYYEQTFQQFGFGNNASDLMISTSYDLIAALYGNKILVLQDIRRRALDLSFFNYTKNGIYFDYWVDNGEINSPGYITAEEVLGFQKRYEDRQRTNWAARVSTNAIDMAYYRMDYKDTSLVLVLDGEKKLCIMKANDSRYYDCNLYQLNLKEKPVPYPEVKNTSQASKAALMGIITNCAPDSTNCPSLSEIQKWYGKDSPRRMSRALAARIESVSVNGKKLHWQSVVSDNRQEDPIPADIESPVANDVHRKIQVVSASFINSAEERANLNVGNATSFASEYLDGKTSPVIYTVSHRFIRLDTIDVSRGFILRWTCEGSDQIHSKKILPPAEGQHLEVTCPSDDNTGE